MPKTDKRVLTIFQPSPVESEQRVKCQKQLNEQASVQTKNEVKMWSEKKKSKSHWFARPMEMDEEKTKQTDKLGTWDI